MSRRLAATSLVVIASLALASPAPAYVPNTLDFVGGSAVVAHWPSSAFPIATRVTIGLTTDVDAVSARAALDAAMATWSGVAGSAASIFVEREAEVQADVFDGINAIEFSNDAALQGAQFVALTLMLTEANGSIVEADMLVNDRGVGFTTTAGSNVGIDLETAMLVEIGRFLGLSSSPVGTLETGNTVHEDSAVMFPISRSIGETARVLRDDDRAGIVSMYPADASRGGIAGQVFRGGAGVFGAHVVVHDPINDVLVGAVTLPDGTFSIGGLPPGLYLLEVMPLPQFVSGQALGGIFATGSVDNTFTRAFLPRALRVTAGQTISGVTLEVQ